MLDIKEIRKKTGVFKKGLARKGVSGGVIDQLLDIDQRRRDLLQVVESMKAEQNAVSKKIAQLSGVEKQQVLSDMKNLSDKKKTQEGELQLVEEQYESLMYDLPNIPFESAPDGISDEENVVLREEGDKTSFSFQPREHWEIAENLELLDTERSAKVSGSRFYYLRNELAVLQQALMMWAFREVVAKGFSATIPPFMTRKEALMGTGFFAKDENYVVNPGEDDLYLIGTSEVPMMGFHADEVLDEGDLPSKFVSYSPCFRREAGTYGKDMKGIFRVHQFEKVEMVVLCRPEESEMMHEELLRIEENLLQQLGLPYRVVNVCCGDLGNSAAKKYDLEAWLPGQGNYREMTSTSICTNFQTRRLNIRVRQKDGSIVHAHSLNGTAVSSRPLVAILENFQRKDGSVVVPKVLVPYCGFEMIRKK